MKTVKVESSNVAAIGEYDAAAGTVRVIYRDGKAYDFFATEAQHAALMAAPSKGQYIFRNLGAATRVAGEPLGHVETKPTQPVPYSGPLRTIEPDPCCGRLIRLAFERGELDRATEWICSRCGEVWKPQAHGAVIHWNMVPAVAIFRR